MPPNTKVIKGASGFIVKHCGQFFRVPRKLIKHGDTADDVARRLANSGRGLDQLKKLKSPRRHLLGPTPGKLDPTGQHVWRRMARNGDLVDGDGLPLDLDDFGGRDSLRDLTKQDLKRIYVMGEDGPIQLKKCDMGHIEGAVEFWIDRGHRMSPDARKQWMLDLEPPPPGKNYQFTPSSLNRSAGGRNPHRYRDVDPTVHAADVPGWP
ncbi:hypothetical protein [Propioniferax innocua]|uniref:hypothetical protein n=1 Tax=Propioniferax innocua TaxID=1753 RepID=UPI00114E9730|nr:hypothetical protein [Propioniferax innocua]